MENAKKKRWFNIHVIQKTHKCMCNFHEVGSDIQNLLSNPPQKINMVEDLTSSYIHENN